MTERPDVTGVAGTLKTLATEIRAGADLVDDWSRHHATDRSARGFAELASSDLYAAAALIQNAAVALVRCGLLETPPT